MIVLTAFRTRFTQIFFECLANGYSCNDARDFASLELTGKPFHTSNE